MSHVLLAMLLVQGQYNRSRVSDTNLNSQCLYWHDGTKIVFSQSNGGNGETPGDTEFISVAKAFTTWQTQLQTCGSLSLEEGPRTGSRSVGYNEKGGDNQNLVLFRQSSCTKTVTSTDSCFRDGTCGNKYDCWEHSAGAIAITTTTYNSETGRIFDADIEMNTPSFIFTTVDTPPCVPPAYSTACIATDVQNTMTHEIGHLMGLAHINVEASVMSAKANPGEISKRTLDTGTAQFVCDVYPKGLPSKACVIVPFRETLGPERTGCSVAPGLSASLLMLVLLRRRRNA